MLISRIQQDLFDFIDFDPEELDGLIEFWYSANSEALSAALTKDEGLKLILNVNNFQHFEQLSKKLFLVADTLILRDTRKWTPEENNFQAIPIPTGEYKPKYLEDIEEELKNLQPSPLTLLYRPNLYWTSTTKILNNGYNIAYAAWEYNAIPKEFKSWIAGSGREYMKTGKIVYGPFIPTLEMELEFMKNKISMPEQFNALPCFYQDYKWLDDKGLDSLLLLKFPYLQNIDIETLSKIKEDNYDEFSKFSDSLLDSIQKIKTSYGSSDFLKEIQYIQKNQIDDNLAKIEQKFNQLSKMQTLRKAGVITGLIGLSGAMLVADAIVPGIVTGATGVVATMIANKAAELKDKFDVKENPAYFLWKIKNYGN
ncbi:MAG: hypothetical protein JSS63_09335 [Bacteroidetes bacterium]|nr:hypothetical protein [Bacteroidota bacterium]